MSTLAAPDYGAAPFEGTDLAPTYSHSALDGGSSSAAFPSQSHQPGHSGPSSSAPQAQQTTFEFSDFKIVFNAPGDSKSVWLSPRRVGEHGATLEGEVIVGPGSKVKEVVVALSGTIEYHNNDSRFPASADRIDADRSYVSLPSFRVRHCRSDLAR